MSIVQGVRSVIISEKTENRVLIISQKDETEKQKQPNESSAGDKMLTPYHQ